MKARDVGRHVSHVAGLDGSACPLPDLDPDEPRDPHESHDLVLFDRYAECADCGARDHWPAIEGACPKTKQGRGLPVSLVQAGATMKADLSAFLEWWEAKGLGTCPDMATWRAELFEWARNPGGRL